MAAGAWIVAATVSASLIVAWARIAWREMAAKASVAEERNPLAAYSAVAAWAKAVVVAAAVVAVVEWMVVAETAFGWEGDYRQMATKARARRNENYFWRMVGPSWRKRMKKRRKKRMDWWVDWDRRWTTTCWMVRTASWRSSPWRSWDSV